MASLLSCTGAAVLACAALPAQATDDWVAVDEAALASMRGGFTTPGGLELALGIERIVSINGEQVSRVTLFALGAAGTSFNAGDSARLIQQGGNNVFAGVLDQVGATVVQNSLNNQAIRTDTLISANVNSAGLLREINFNNALNLAAITAAGSH